jgi:hypothetical protein
LVEGAGIDITVDDGANTITIASTITQYTDEQARDAVGTALVEGAGIDITVDDGADTITIASTITQYTDEQAQDAAAALIQNGTGISWAYNDGLNTLTPTITLAPFSTTDLAEGANLYFTDERVDDRVAVLMNDSASITWTYLDGLNQLFAARAALTGDVTAAANSNATTIADGAVSNAKLADMAAWTYKIRNAGSSGDPSDAALADFTTDTPVSGDFVVGFLDTGEIRKFDVAAFFGGGYTDEQARDAIGTALVEGAGIDITVNDPADTITIASTITQYTDEMAQDAVGAMIDSSLTYVDGTPLLQTTKASTTEVLTGTDAVKAVTADALAALWEEGSAIASAATISVGEGGVFHVTGTTTISDIDFGTDRAGRCVWLIFDSSLTLTHNATTLILPGGADIITLAGSIGLFMSEDGSDNVRCLAFMHSGTPQFGAASQAQMEAGTSVGTTVTPLRQQFHPSAAKFWVKATGNSTTIEVSYNMTSWADTAVGIADGTIATDFSSVDWAGHVNLLGAASNWNTTNTSGCGFTSQAAGTFTVAASQMTEGGTAAANPLDPTAWFVTGLGDQ